MSYKAIYLSSLSTPSVIWPYITLTFCPDEMIRRRGLWPAPVPGPRPCPPFLVGRRHSGGWQWWVACTASYTMRCSGRWHSSDGCT
jgi:hypothetical protein